MPIEHSPKPEKKRPDRDRTTSIADPDPDHQYEEPTETTGPTTATSTPAASRPSTPHPYLPLTLPDEQAPPPPPHRVTRSQSKDKEREGKKNPTFKTKTGSRNSSRSKSVEKASTPDEGSTYKMRNVTASDLAIQRREETDALKLVDQTQAEMNNRIPPNARNLIETMDPNDIFINMQWITDDLLRLENDIKKVEIDIINNEIASEQMKASLRKNPTAKNAKMAAATLEFVEGELRKHRIVRRGLQKEYRWKNIESQQFTYALQLLDPTSNKPENTNNLELAKPVPHSPAKQNIDETIARALQEKFDSQLATRLAQMEKAKSLKLLENEKERPEGNARDETIITQSTPKDDIKSTETAKDEKTNHLAKEIDKLRLSYEELLETSRLASAAVKPKAPQGSQIAHIPTFKGDFGPKAENWLRIIDRSQNQYSWTDLQTALIARSKLEEKAQLFVDNQEKEMVKGINSWNDTTQDFEPLRVQLENTFTIPSSASAASTAIQDLKQGSDSVQMFYEKCRYAVDKFLYRIPKETEPEKENYKMNFQHNLWIFFRGGLSRKYTEIIFSAMNKNQPQTAEQLLKVARASELEMNKAKLYSVDDLYSKHSNFKNINEVSMEKDNPQEQDSNPKEQVTMGKLLEGINAIRKQRNRSRSSTRSRSRSRSNSRSRSYRSYKPKHNYNFKRYRSKSSSSRQKYKSPRRSSRSKSRRRSNGNNEIQKKKSGCFHCGSKDHWINECPMLKDQKNLKRDYRKKLCAMTAALMDDSDLESGTETENTQSVSSDDDKIYEHPN